MTGRLRPGKARKGTPLLSVPSKYLRRNAVGGFQRRERESCWVTIRLFWRNSVHFTNSEYGWSIQSYVRSRDFISLENSSQERRNWAWIRSSGATDAFAYNPWSRGGRFVHPWAEFQVSPYVSSFIWLLQTIPGPRSKLCSQLAGSCFLQSIVLCSWYANDQSSGSCRICGVRSQGAQKENRNSLPHWAEQKWPHVRHYWGLWDRAQFFPFSALDSLGEREALGSLPIHARPPRSDRGWRGLGPSIIYDIAKLLSCA